MLLAPLEHASLAKLYRNLCQLSGHLGEDHDLLLLGERARHSSLDAVSQRALTSLIVARRKKLQRNAMAAGDRCYAQRPRDFDRRLRGYFREWRSK